MERGWALRRLEGLPGDGRPPKRPTCPAAHLPGGSYPFAHLPTCPFARLPACPLTYLPGEFCPTARLPTCPAAHLPGEFCPFAHLPGRPPTRRLLPSCPFAQAPNFQPTPGGACPPLLSGLSSTSTPRRPRTRYSYPEKSRAFSAGLYCPLPAAPAPPPAPIVAASQPMGSTLARAMRRAPSSPRAALAWGDTEPHVRIYQSPREGVSQH